MKYDVTYSCGHKDVVELFGKTEEREKKLAWYASAAVCPCCYARRQAGRDIKEVAMSYRDYKADYSDCKTKPGSYDAKTKTITVYIPMS
jgi:hypothetical protein